MPAARSAYSTLDIDASKVAHEQAPEQHSHAGGKLRTFVFGGLDGILTCFALISSCAGAAIDARVVLVMGICNIFADALAMGVGEYLSSKSSTDFARHERSREAWEFENNPEGEIEEMIAIYEQRGMSHEDAEVVVTRMAKYPEFFINVMMVDELGLEVPAEDANITALLDGLLMFCAFVVLGLLPLLGYIALPLIWGADAFSPESLFLAACVVTSGALFLLGAAKASFVGQNWFKLGTETLLLGALCATVAFTTGRFLSGALAESMPARR